MKFFNDSRVNQLVEVVRQAGKELLLYWSGNRDVHLRPTILEKSDGSPVSTADLRSNEILSAGIAQLFDSDLIFSEETDIDPQKVVNSPRTWIIDPLDGTAAFLAGREDFAVLVALVEAHQPVIGIMFFPASDQLLVAQRGAGVQCNSRPLRVSPHSSLGTGRVYVRNFQCTRPELGCTPRDSSVALLQVANGELDGAIIKMTSHREWDIAAPIVAITEAGGRVTDEHGSEISCGLGTIPYRYFVASNRLNHQEIQSLIPKDTP